MEGTEPHTDRREKRDLEEAIAARDEVVEAATRDRAHYQADLEAVVVEEMARMEAAEELARVAADEELARLAAHEAMTSVQRVHWDSSLAEATEHHRREESLLRWCRAKAIAVRMCSNNDVGPSSHVGSQ
jgi:hypothetical protein